MRFLLETATNKHVLYLQDMSISHVSILIQHWVFSRMNKQDSTPLGGGRLTDRHTQIIHSSQALHAVQLCWVLTDTSQQQLYPKQNREDNNKSDAWRFVTIFCLCTTANAAHSGCSSILPPQFNSCPLIYIHNLATIKIPRLLVNSLSLSRSTSHLICELWQLCHVMQMPHQPIQICVRGTLALFDASTERQHVSQEPEAHWHVLVAFEQHRLVDRINSWLVFGHFNGICWQQEKSRAPSEVSFKNVWIVFKRRKWNSQKLSL